VLAIDPHAGEREYGEPVQVTQVTTPPETHYARSGEVRIAYQVVGSGPFDLVYVPGFVSNLDNGWDDPGFAHFFRRLASFSRLILFDKRGTGLSDRDAQIPSLEQRMDDVRAVMDAVGSTKAAVFGVSEGGAMAMLFAATYPERISALVLYGAYAHFPTWVLPDDQVPAFIAGVEARWGTGESVKAFAPEAGKDPQVQARWARFERLGASPSAVIALTRMNCEIDVRHVLPAIRVPTLVIHRAGDARVKVGAGRYLGEHIPNAKYIELPGIDHAIWLGETDSIVDEVETYLTGVRPTHEADRVLATLLFTDIVDSTKRATELGDRRWRELLEQHNTVARREIARFRGREIKTLGDGFLAAFDGPARAVRCSLAVAEGVRPLGLAIRAGMHTGEVEFRGDDVGGIAVNIAARVAAEASGPEILVSNTVRDLVAGSGLAFQDRGMHTLKGVPEQLRLFAVAA
jgi:class 3 adenylate cyclase